MTATLNPREWGLVTRLVDRSVGRGLHGAEETSNVQHHIVERGLPVGRDNYLLHVQS